LSLPKLTKEDKLDETVVRRRMDIMNLTVFLRGHPNSIPYTAEHIAGLPQGAPTSPFLSILVLSKILEMNATLRDKTRVEYADDGVLLSSEPIESKEDKIYNLNQDSDPVIRSLQDITMFRAGIRYAPHKSGYVKYAGKWIKPLKFLGLVYDGIKDE
jgi:hypothetical protein